LSVSADTSWCPDGFVCLEGKAEKCKAGHYCPRNPAANLSGAFTEGFSGAFTEIVCSDSSQYCPRGSVEPQKVEPGFYSTPEGKDQPKNAQKLCENSAVYCTTGLRLKVTPGYYSGKSSGRHLQNEHNYRRLLQKSAGATLQNPCEEGYYCEEGTGVKIKCPRGTVCPKLSKKPLPCKESEFLCDGKSRTKIIGGYFAVRDSKGNVINKILCPQGSYCSQGQNMTVPRESFYYGVGTLYGETKQGRFRPVRTGASDILRCSSGQICTDLGNRACPGGFECLLGATDTNGGLRACKAGYYSKVGQLIALYDWLLTLHCMLLFLPTGEFFRVYHV
jgi:hypothetical protein